MINFPYKSEIAKLLNKAILTDYFEHKFTSNLESCHALSLGNRKTDRISDNSQQKGLTLKRYQPKKENRLGDIHGK